MKRTLITAVILGSILFAATVIAFLVLHAVGWVDSRLGMILSMALTYLVFVFVPGVGRRFLVQRVEADDLQDIDAAWLDAELDAILARTELEAPRGEAFFLDPNAEMGSGRSLYDLLSEQDPVDIARACTRILRHTGMREPPPVAVSFFGSAQPANAPGEQRVAYIEIEAVSDQPIYLVHVNRGAVRETRMLGAVLAHELSHIVEKRLGYPQRGILADELRTDLLAFVFGLGELWLRGAVEQRDLGKRDGRQLVQEMHYGYLDHRLAAWAQARIEAAQDCRLERLRCESTIAFWLKRCRRWARAGDPPEFPFLITKCHECEQRLRYPRRDTTLELRCPRCSCRRVVA